MAKGRRGPNKKPGPKTKSKWRDEFIDQVGPLIRSGMKIPQLCDFFKITAETYNKWKNENKRFSDEITKARDYLDCKTSERSLQQRVKGFHYNETIKEKNSKTGELETTKTIRKMIPPDVTAIKMHLTNRDRQRWPDKQNVEHGFDAVTLDLILSALPPEYAKSVKAALEAKK
jgi:hypothetical protein